MSLLYIKSHSCPKKVTSVEEKSLLFISLTAFTEEPKLQLKKTLLFSKSHFCPQNECKPNFPTNKEMSTTIIVN